MTEEKSVTAAPLMSSRDFAQLGMEDIAFVKRVVTNDEVEWSIHSAAGNSIGLAPSRELAFAAVLQNELEPVSVH